MQCDLEANEGLPRLQGCREEKGGVAEEGRKQGRGGGGVSRRNCPRVTSLNTRRTPLRQASRTPRESPEKRQCGLTEKQRVQQQQLPAGATAPSAVMHVHTRQWLVTVKK